MRLWPVDVPTRAAVQLLSLILRDVEKRHGGSVAASAERAPWTDLGLFEVLLPVAVKQARPPTLSVLEYPQRLSGWLPSDS